VQLNLSSDQIIVQLYGHENITLKARTKRKKNSVCLSLNFYALVFHGYLKTSIFRHDKMSERRCW